jgi:two-component sensor histidine kinase
MVLEDLYRLLRSSHVQAQGVVDTMTQPIVVLDASFGVTTANNAFLRTFSVERDSILGENFYGLGNGQWDIPELRQLISSVIPKAAAGVGFEVKHEFPVIGQRTFLVDARRLVHPNDNSTSILLLFDDVTERQRHDAEMNLIMGELRHRVKNLLAVVRSIAMQTETDGRSAADYRETLLGRLEITLNAQDMAAANIPADFEELVKQSIGDANSDRLRFEGEPLELPASLVVTVSLIFHELATNARKYGALSAPDGVVSISWSLQSGSNERAQLTCEWREENGPPVKPPQRRGYGTELIQGTSAHLGGSVQLHYEPRGLEATISIPL